MAPRETAESCATGFANGRRLWRSIFPESSVNLEQAAAKVHAKLLVIVSPEDHMVNPEPAIQFAAAVHAPVVKLDSPCGHLSPGCISVGPTVARFLADPASVQSETLREPAKRE